MPPLSIMLKPASSLCNLRCQYCFYADEAAHREQASYGIMSEDTLEAILKRTLAFAEGSCTIVYQGGEPTLAGLDFFRRAIELETEMERQRRRHPPFHSDQRHGAEPGVGGLFQRSTAFLWVCHWTGTGKSTMPTA